MANARTNGKKPAPKTAQRGRAAAPAKQAARGRQAAPAPAKPKQRAAAPAPKGRAAAPKQAPKGRAPAPKGKPAPKQAPKAAPKAAPKRAAAPAPKRKPASNLFDVNVWLNDGFRTVVLESSSQEDVGLQIAYKDHLGNDKSELVLYKRLVSYSEGVAIIRDRVLVDTYEDVTVSAESPAFLDVTTEDGAVASIVRHEPDYTIEIVPAGEGAARGAVATDDAEEGEEGGEEEYAEDGEGEYEEEGEAEEGDGFEGDYEEGEEGAEEGEEGEEGEYDDSEGYEEGESEEGEEGEYEEGDGEEYEEYEE